MAERLSIFVAALLLATFLRPSAEPDKYEIFAVRFATIANFPVSSLVAGADRARRIDIAMTLWVLKGFDGRVALVDSGFHRDQYFKQFAVRDFILPSDALAPLGIKPNDVTDIFLSHMHWDHAGGIDLFPAARVWVQKDEYDYYIGEAWQSRTTHGGIGADDVLELVKRNTQGKVTLVRGDDDSSISGVTFNIGGRHTWASQFMTAETRGGVVVLASDNLYLYENLDQHKAIAQTLDAVSNLRAQERMRGLVASPRFIIPGHDPAVFERFPHVTDRIVRIE